MNIVQYFRNFSLNIFYIILSVLVLSIFLLLFFSLFPQLCHFSFHVIYFFIIIHHLSFQFLQLLGTCIPLYLRCLVLGFADYFLPLQVHHFAPRLLPLACDVLSHLPHFPQVLFNVRKMLQLQLAETGRSYFLFAGFHSNYLANFLSNFSSKII